MKDYMLLFRGAFDDRKASPEEFQKEAVKWQKWMEKLLKEGRLTPGQRLANSGKVVSGTGKHVHDGPFAEGKEVVASFCIIKVRDLAEAVEFAKSCPILDYDGSVEVREVMVY
ncbi:MAG TPA: YciI family protein [Candidatus Kryptobacter bacterium]|nr:MAG: hypothetical protein B7Z63_00220 [Ignavibacteriae bacterium 37-53-5]HQT91277.1 YciI family protein [Candidatus Kryptobacter bacterium]